VIVRYADDFVMGFEDGADAQQMRADLQQRLAGFGLTLHEDKTRLIEFGRLPAIVRRRRGERHPETFAFLGFTHYCGWTRDGRFIVKHKTQSKRLTRKLTASPGGVEADASAAGRATPLVRQRPAWPLRLLRHAPQLPRAQRLPASGATNLARLPQAAKPEEPHHGLGDVRGCDRTLPPAYTSDHSSLGSTNGMTRTILGKSRVRESRTPGSVRAKAEWLSYSTTTLKEGRARDRVEIDARAIFLHAESIWPSAGR
jgi:hypothetical protein